ncbi:hypothetical protein CYLTODRAFT_417431 [Cylindrobasidium torrendii FP15055 ss-10]|uniref:Uncharacterized protein n=1 Tax=Cylindrobasidium torrendii FP15055 ss-10 TaxID=1314674 RepID=A0A0D7BR64_9AGAR|nr:hypothetical protein CYLTODRAFT_417431 [Cylindrobasidium torrendii FP15055 ss-10]
MATKLTPSLKHLLTLRNPNPLPSPSYAHLRKVLASTYQDAQAKDAETGWLVLSTCTLLTLNRPPTLSHLWNFVAETDGGEADRQLALPLAVNRAAIMREAALKSTIFVGVPRVILSLAAFHDALDDEVKQQLRSVSRRDPAPDTAARGRALWDSIYAPFEQKLHDKLGSYHPDFISFIIQAYGSVLSPLPGSKRMFGDESMNDDPDQGNLSQALGSVVGVACLRAEERVIPQLTSHVFGLLKARHLKNQNGEDVWLSSDEGAAWVLRTIDAIVEGVASEGPVEKSKL